MIGTTHEPLAERVGSRENNFDALRLIAAVMVLVLALLSADGPSRAARLDSEE